jgi:predicted house-cleaning NTP pyrophosphatase (Maf/HAM1 superfamily)
MLVLASQSPRRRQLINLLGWEFTVIPANVNEDIFPQELPGEYVRRVALEKALESSRKLRKNTGMEDFIIGADTAVVDWGRNTPPGDMPDKGQEISGVEKRNFEILGKPSDPFEARSVLIRLRGRVHQVFSAIAVIRSHDGKQFIDTCITDVPMRGYSDKEIEAYVASGDPLDKAGSYAIQHTEFHPVQNLQGCYANVMGLPLCHLLRTLISAGRHTSRDVPSACQAFLEFDCPVYNEILESE